MLLSYVKLALKVLLRRKFFTAISLFGIAFTLTVALVGTAVFDHMIAPVPPEVNLERTLHAGGLYLEVAKGDSVRSTTAGAGYPLLDQYARDLPGVERVEEGWSPPSRASEPASEPASALGSSPR